MPYLSNDELLTFIADENGDDKCGRCRFWTPHEAPSWREVLKHKYPRYAGGCHRRAPIIVEMEGGAEDCALWPGICCDGGWTRIPS